MSDKPIIPLNYQTPDPDRRRRFAIHWGLPALILFVGVGSVTGYRIHLKHRQLDPAVRIEIVPDK